MGTLNFPGVRCVAVVSVNKQTNKQTWLWQRLEAADQWVTERMELPRIARVICDPRILGRPTINFYGWQPRRTIDDSHGDGKDEQWGKQAYSGPAQD